jgi:beta-galactosidase GanA
MLYFGVDYYPEQWPEERWLEDAQIMAEVDFNVVRLAEFAWSKIEPNEGHYDLDSLDLAELNHAWGTMFWSHVYGDWADAAQHHR